MRFFLLATTFLLFGGLSLAANFSDNDRIPEWAQTPISSLVEAEIITGNSDGTFAPTRPMNRAEFCKVLVNATDAKKYLPLASSFPDVERSDWFFDDVETARYYGWLAGYPNGTFLPGNKINRAEAAKILANAFQLPVLEAQDDEAWYMPYFRTLDTAGLLPYGTSLENLNPNESPNRAEIAEQVARFMVHAGTLPSYQETSTAEANAPSEQASTIEQTNQGAPVEQFQYTESASTSQLPVDASAGTLLLEKDKGLLQKIKVSQNQQNIVAHKIKLRSENGLTEISSFQFRLVGNGSYMAVSDVWLELDGRKITDKVNPTNNLVSLPLKQTKLTVGTSIKTVILKIDISSTAKTGENFRWVLYLPEWIGANTDKKVGFFPIGGSNIEVQ
ncbi:S-layer homology domain-containing protein [Candidatus Gracilibacteria bacterium]|nr:S-layer homology domain-containing protein [Candidatus Gracilibacteria bacterium]